MLPLNEKQIEIENLLRSIGKDGATIPSNVIAEIIELIDSPKPEEGRSQSLDERTIRLKMMEEKDWRKKAAMAAMIISKSLE